MLTFLVFIVLSNNSLSHVNSNNDLSDISTLNIYSTVAPTLSNGGEPDGELLEKEFYVGLTLPPVADFSADTTTIGINQTVYFTDLSTNTPTSWQWTFTPSTVVFVGGTSATSQNPQVEYTATGDYEVQLESTNTFGNDIETKTGYISVSLLMNYCLASGGSGYEYISRVLMGNIDNSTGDDGYANYTTMSTDITILESYNITVWFANANDGDDLGVWVDWNQDGDFNDDEQVSCNMNMSATQKTNSIEVPSSALTGPTTMRIRLKLSGGNCGSPCGNTDHGEVEDYKVNILSNSTTWIGTTIVWNLVSNWTDGVPDLSYEVTIPALPSGGNFPTIASSNNAECYNLTLEGSATVIVNGNLEVKH